MNLPLMNLHERVLSVLGCRFVDDVLIDAPYILTVDVIASLHIHEVVYDENTVSAQEAAIRYSAAASSGILHKIQVTSDYDINKVIARIKDNQSMFQERFQRKMGKEKEFFETKYAPKKMN